MPEINCLPSKTAAARRRSGKKNIHRVCILQIVSVLLLPVDTRVLCKWKEYLEEFSCAE